MHMAHLPFIVYKHVDYIKQIKPQGLFYLYEIIRWTQNEYVTFSNHVEIVVIDGMALVYLQVSIICSTPVVSLTAWKIAPYSKKLNEY